MNVSVAMQLAGLSSTERMTVIIKNALLRAPLAHVLGKLGAVPFQKVTERKAGTIDFVYANKDFLIDVLIQV